MMMMRPLFARATAAFHFAVRGFEFPAPFSTPSRKGQKQRPAELDTRQVGSLVAAMDWLVSLS